MKKKTKSDGISRRKFIKGFSGGVVGTTVLVHTLPGAVKADEAKAGAAHEAKEHLSLKVNGKTVKLLIEPRVTLAEVLRDQLQLTGTKIVCNKGECGGCTVILDGEAVYSCMLLALDAAGKEVITIEGLLDGEKINRLQQAFIDEDGMQCGFCTPGQIMTAQALLLKNPHPTKEQVKEAMSGNLCRCGAYPNIVNSVLVAAKKS